jgi:hypothetical protein
VTDSNAGFMPAHAMDALDAGEPWADTVLLLLLLLLWLLWLRPCTAVQGDIQGHVMLDCRQWLMDVKLLHLHACVPTCALSTHFMTARAKLALLVPVHLQTLQCWVTL